MIIDSVLSVKSSSPYHLIGSLKRSTVEQKDSGISSIISTGKETVKTGINMVKPLVMSIFGFAGLIGGSLMATFFKDHTAADWGAKLFTIAGGILAVFGIYDFSKVVREQKTQIQTKVEHTNEKVSDSLGPKCKEAEKELVSSDLSLNGEAISLTKGALSLNKANNIRAQVIKLLETYTDPELRTWVNNYVDGIEPALVNISISKDPVSRSDFRDRIALLLGNAVSSRARIKADEERGIYPAIGANCLANILEKQQLVLSAPSDADPAIKTEAEIANMLPDDFSFVFNFARYYADDHMLKNDSLNGVIGDEKDIKILETLVQKPHEGTEKNNAEKYLNQLQNAENYFNVLKYAIDYVLSNPADTDEKTVRNVAVLRQALVCGFRMTSETPEDNTDEQLHVLLNGLSKDGVKYAGLKEKIEQLEKHDKENIEPIRANEKFPFVRKEKTADEIDSLSGVTLSEYSQVV